MACPITLTNVDWYRMNRRDPEAVRAALLDNFVIPNPEVTAALADPDRPLVLKVRMVFGAPSDPCPHCGGSLDGCTYCGALRVDSAEPPV